MNVKQLCLNDNKAPNQCVDSCMRSDLHTSSYLFERCAQLLCRSLWDTQLLLWTLVYLQRLHGDEISLFCSQLDAVICSVCYTVMSPTGQWYVSIL